MLVRSLLGRESPCCGVYVEPGAPSEVTCPRSNACSHLWKWSSGCCLANLKREQCPPAERSTGSAKQEGKIPLYPLYHSEGNSVGKTICAGSCAGRCKRIVSDFFLRSDSKKCVRSFAGTLNISQPRSLWSVLCLCSQSHVFSFHSLLSSLWIFCNDASLRSLLKKRFFGRLRPFSHRLNDNLWHRNFTKYWQAHSIS